MNYLEQHKVSAVIVTWNPDIERFIKILASISDQVAEIIIVDNNSRNINQLMECAGVHNAKVLCQTENLGIGAAINIGVRNVDDSLHWILTMDQDSVIEKNAVNNILNAYKIIKKDDQLKIGIIALKTKPQPLSNVLTRYAEKLQRLGTYYEFEELRAVITSGSIIPYDVAKSIKFNEELFIDQVDFDYCYKIRQCNLKVIRGRQIAIDHQLGVQLDLLQKKHNYENAQRFYYIVRNSTFLVLRKRILVRFYFSQLLVFCGAFIISRGWKSIILCVRIILRGLFDGIFVRLGRREYKYLKNP